MNPFRLTACFLLVLPFTMALRSEAAVIAQSAGCAGTESPGACMLVTGVDARPRAPGTRVDVVPGKSDASGHVAAIAPDAGVAVSAGIRAGRGDVWARDENWPGVGYRHAAPVPTTDLQQWPARQAGVQRGLVEGQAGLQRGFVAGQAGERRNLASGWAGERRDRAAKLAGERPNLAAGRAGDRRDVAAWRTGGLRVFALYGPREFSTFSDVGGGPQAGGETAPLNEPLDRHAEDPWLGIDKAKHVAFSFLWTLGTQYVAVNKGHLSEAQALPLSIGTSAAVGLSKEYYDLRSGPPNVFSYKDLVANGVGILLATGVILL